MTLLGISGRVLVGAGWFGIIFGTTGRGLVEAPLPRSVSGAWRRLIEAHSLPSVRGGRRRRRGFLAAPALRQRQLQRRSPMVGLACAAS